MKRLNSGLFACLATWLSATVICSVLGVAFVLPAHAVSVPFNIATNGASMSASFDGTNYLVGIANHLTSPTSIGAQMISTTGVKVGSLIPTGHNGIATAVAFDGMNHLLIWENDPGGTESGRFQIYGQFISKAGTIVGSPFAITSAGIWFDGMKTMAFGNGKYLVTYTRLINPELGDRSDNRYIVGIIVNPDGSMGTEFRISTGYGDASDVAFDGTNFFVVWTEDYYDTEIRGRFVSTSGTLVGTEISVNASAYPSDNPKSVIFDGTNYMVIWTDAVDATRMWDVFGQQISTSGALIGEVITITNENGPQMATSVSFDGTNYLATWVDMTNDANQNGACDTGEGSCWDLYGQYISKTGSLYGSKFMINADAGNQMGGAGFINGSYLAIINSGVIMGDGGISSVEGVYGLFITPASSPAAPTITSLSASNGTIDSAITVTGTNFVSGATSVAFNGTLCTKVMVADSNHLTAYVPSGATSGTITVTTAGGTATSTNFDVQYPLNITILGGNGMVLGSVRYAGDTASSYLGQCFDYAPQPCQFMVTIKSTLATATLEPQTTSPASYFSGWSGADRLDGIFAYVDITEPNKSVTSVFSLYPIVMNLSTTPSYYSTLSSAFNAALTNSIFMVQKSFSPASTAFNRSNVTATLKGGFDSTFSNRSPTDFTSISYPLTIQTGTLILDQIAVK